MADYFVQKRKKGDYTPEPIQLRHIQEVLQLLSVMTGDHQLEDAYNKIEKGAVHIMCEMLERTINKGIAKGKAEGENLIVTLMQKLFAAGRVEDAQRAANDAQYRGQLLMELGLVPQ